MPVSAGMSAFTSGVAMPESPEESASGAEASSWLLLTSASGTAPSGCAPTHPRIPLGRRRQCRWHRHRPLQLDPNQRHRFHRPHRRVRRGTVCKQESSSARRSRKEHRYPNAIAARGGGQTPLIGSTPKKLPQSGAESWHSSNYHSPPHRSHAGRIYRRWGQNVNRRALDHVPRVLAAHLRRVRPESYNRRLDHRLAEVAGNGVCPRHLGLAARRYGWVQVAFLCPKVHLRSFRSGWAALTDDDNAGIPAFSAAPSRSSRPR